MGKFKDFLKKILPPPTTTFHREIGILKKNDKILNQNVQNLHNEVVMIHNDIKECSDQQKEELKILRKSSSELKDIRLRVEKLESRIDQLEHGYSEAAGQTDRKIGELSEHTDVRIDALDRSLKDHFSTEMVENMGGRITDEIRSEYDALVGKVDENTKITSDISSRLTSAADSIDSNAGRLSELDMKIQKGVDSSGEILWAEIYNDTIEGCDWLKDTAFSPGRWAVGYQFLYVLFRILNEIQPQRILDLGLGQSSKMISQYAHANASVEHIIVEHNPEWVEYFKLNYTLPDNCKVKILDLDFVDYKDAKSVRVYKGFKESFAGQRFNLISIDAPLGGDMKDYARIDILTCLPEIIAEDFIILLDDHNRSGERHTAEEMRRVLKANGIPFAYGTYKGEKELMVICSKRFEFLITM